MSATVIRLFFAISMLMAGTSLPASENLPQYGSIYYEYHKPDSVAVSPVVVCVPGFTQHNGTREYQVLKSFLDSLGFSYLIMNPPRHGAEQVSSGSYDWGDEEVDVLAGLVSHLRLWSEHSAVHLLGFSIGGKVVLKLAARPGIRDSITSVIAVAAPFRVGDINLRFSGEITHPFEISGSGFQAAGRSGVLRMLSMVLMDMNRSLLYNTASPANDISAIAAPVLLIHGSGDWLTRSYHSSKLYEAAGADKTAALVFIDTHTHAEDMLTRDSVPVRDAFLETLSCWYRMIRPNKPLNTVLQDRARTQLNNRFHGILRLNGVVGKKLYERAVTMMTSPTYVNLGSNLWMSVPEHNYAVATVNSSFGLNREKNTHHFFTLAWPRASDFMNRFRLGLSTVGNTSTSTQFELYSSFYYPFGSNLWFRRLTYVSGIGNTVNRKILSMDLAFLQLDFQLNFGKFEEGGSGSGENDWQVAFDLPLIDEAGGRYQIGLGYSHFFTGVSAPYSRNMYKGYVFLGIFDGAFLHLQYEQDRLNPQGATKLLSGGLTLNIGK